MFYYLIKAKETALDILFPRVCLNCEKSLNGENRLICDACFSLIKINSAFLCPICRGRLPDLKKTCHPKSPFILAPAGEYGDPILQNIIKLFKYQSIENLAPVLGEIIVRYIENCKLKIENCVIVPVPLHKSRERQRGFNQAKLLARYIAEHFNLPLIESLKRVKKTKPQAQMKNKKERLKNISGCFKIINPDSIKEKNAILIDDVFTTGDTMNEAVKILKENRCGKIIALVAAKV
ncbi:MAG: ComF family protein [Spirochaetota bacterium]